MANILIVSSNLRDWTKSSGGSERTATLAEALKDHKVTFLSFKWDYSESDTIINDSIREICVPVEPQVLRKYKTYIRGTAQNNYDIAFQMLAPFLKNYRKKIKELAKQNDILILDHYAAAPLVEDVRGIPIVYNSHNAEISMALQLYPEDKRAISIVKEMEQMAIDVSVGVTYCSKDDFNFMQQKYSIGNRSSAYVPNGTVVHSKIKPSERFRSKDILFVGSGHYPNKVAAKNLIPIARAMPDYNFVVVGGASGALKEVGNLPSNIDVRGHVSDEELDKLFRNSFAFINPMESGSGTHLKMMRAFGYGIPVISSQIGARGLEDDELSGILVAKNPVDFVAAIKQLSKKDRFTFYCNASAELGKKFDWDLINQDYAKFIEGLIVERPESKEIVQESPKVFGNRPKVLVYSIIRDRADSMDRYYKQLRDVVLNNPEYEFYLSVYENDSNDGTKQKLFMKDWSFFSGVSIVTENIKTQSFGSVKDAQRVENLAKARDKGIQGGGFLDKVDYVLMVEGDVHYDQRSVKNLLKFSNQVPDFDVVSAVSLRKNGTHYDWWATRTSAVFDSKKSELDPSYGSKEYGRYYSTSNGLCLYRAEPFQKGVRHHWINTETKEPDCEMVVLCQNLASAGYGNIYINYKSIAHHF
jgi:glycosyltransferase involved in cell wall biosynthesis